MSDHKRWSNYSTWKVAYWYNPETKWELDAIKCQLEELIDEMPAGFIRDAAQHAYNAINWDEIKETLDR